MCVSIIVDKFPNFCTILLFQSYGRDFGSSIESRYCERIAYEVCNHMYWKKFYSMPLGVAEANGVLKSNALVLARNLHCTRKKQRIQQHFGDRQNQRISDALGKKANKLNFVAPRVSSNNGNNISNIMIVAMRKQLSFGTGNIYLSNLACSNKLQSTQKFTLSLLTDTNITYCNLPACMHEQN